MRHVAWLSGKRANSGLAALMLAGACMWGLPGSATADTSGTPTMNFSLPASNGYTFQVRTEGSLAEVSAWREDPIAPASSGLPESRSARLEATYFADDSVSAEGIDADLGALGEVHVRFIPSGRVQTVHVAPRAWPQGCRPPRILRRRLGNFEGSISFSGEGGYTSVEATSAPGRIGPSASRLCSREAPLERRVGAPQLPDVEHIRVRPNVLLSASERIGRQDPTATLLFAGPSETGVHYEVGRIEYLPDGLAVRRIVNVDGPWDGFSYRRDLSTATLRPPEPFRGSATYSKADRRLEGSLSVLLPGLAPPRLTGPSFKARLSRRP